MTTPSPEHVEHVARAICIADGTDPDAEDMYGDPFVPGGTRSWPKWHEAVKASEAAILASQEWERNNATQQPHQDTRP